MEITIDGMEELSKKLKKLAKIDKDIKDRVVKKQLAEMRNRASKPPYTPVDSGYMKNTRAYRVSDGTFGYRAEYAPHVEFGHRTRSGGYVKGQRFLKKNADEQLPIFKEDLRILLEE